MNFLERFFAVCPDGGSGTTELLLLSAIALGLLTVFLNRSGLCSVRSLFK
jgi:hypothetical protein